MKTNMMIVTAAISAGVAEGLSKMEPVPQVQQQQQNHSEIAERYATDVFESYADYWANWKQYMNSNGGVFNFTSDKFCPTNGRVLLKKTVNGHDNFVVLVGEKHEESYETKYDAVAKKHVFKQVTYEQGGYAGAFVEAMKKKIQGDHEITKVAAIELPVLKEEDAVQYVKANADRNCNTRVGALNSAPNCKLPQEFEAEKDNVVGAQSVVGSGAGRVDAISSNEEQTYKFNVQVSLDALRQNNLHLASINHTIFEQDVENAGLRIRGGEPAEAMMFGGDVKIRNPKAANRIDTLATKEEPEKSTVVVFSYGIMHLCEGQGYRSIQRELIETLGWDVVNDDYAMVQDAANYVPQQQQAFLYAEQLQQMCDMKFTDLAKCKQALIAKGGDLFEAIGYYQQNQQNQQQHQRFSEQKIQEVRDILKCTRQEAIDALVVSEQYNM